MTLPAIVLGAGGHAKVLLDVLQICSIPVIGITDPDPEKHNTTILNTPVIGDDSAVMRYKPNEVHLVNGLGTTGVSPGRHRLFKHFKELGYSFASIVHPSAVISPHTQLGEGVQVMAAAVVQPGTVIGSNSIINTNSSVDHDCIIGESVHIAPGVTISGSVNIGSGSHIGSGAVIIQGVKIGARSLIGAGALVLKDVPPETAAFGVPCRSKRKA